MSTGAQHFQETIGYAAAGYLTGHRDSCVNVASAPDVRRISRSPLLAMALAVSICTQSGQSQLCAVDSELYVPAPEHTWLEQY